MLEHRVRGRPVVSLRLTNCYGPRLRIRDARQTFLGIWIRCVLEQRPFEVWGGAQLRDLTYVDDVTEAFLLAADRSECHGRIFNIGGPPPASLHDIAELMVRVAGPPAHYTTREFPGRSRQGSISAATTPTTAHSVQRLAGSRGSGWRRGSGGRWSGTARGWGITFSKVTLRDPAEQLLEQGPALAQELVQCARALGWPLEWLEAVVIDAVELLDRPLVELVEVDLLPH